MKKILKISIPAFIVLIAALLYANFTKSGSAKTINNSLPVVINSSGKAAGADLCCLDNLRASKYSDNSIYLLKNTWKDQNSKSVNLDAFSGKQVIMAMIYTSCTTACPVIVNNMQSIEAAIPVKDLSNYHFLLVSIDPERDTPARLKEFADEKNLNQKRWTLLTGSETDIAELAQAIGFKYRHNRQGTFTHSNLITFINSQGCIINQIEGLNVKPEKVLNIN